MLRRLFAVTLLTVAVTVAGAPSAAAGGCDSSFTLVNNSSKTVYSFFYNPSSFRRWGPDRLGRGVLRPGQAKFWRPAIGGAYDFRVVLTDNRSAELRNLDICVVQRIRVTNQGLRAE